MTKISFYLWNTGLETGMLTPNPPPPQMNRFRLIDEVSIYLLDRNNWLVFNRTLSIYFCLLHLSIFMVFALALAFTPAVLKFLAYVIIGEVWVVQAAILKLIISMKIAQLSWNWTQLSCGLWKSAVQQSPSGHILVHQIFGLIPTFMKGFNCRHLVLFFWRLL